MSRVSRDLHKRVSNCKAIAGVQSDHSAVKADFMIASIKYKAKAISRGSINWRKLATDDRYSATYAKYLAETTDGSTNYDDFFEAAIKAAEMTAVDVKTKNEGWFNFSRDQNNNRLEKIYT